MKSAYELAMERLNKSQPMGKLDDKQKAEIAELDSKYAAKIAEREILLKDRISEAAQSGDFDKQQELEAELARERKSLQADLEEKKERVRNRK
jgi:hypothetical protein